MREKPIPLTELYFLLPNQDFILETSVKLTLTPDQIEKTRRGHPLTKEELIEAKRRTLERTGLYNKIFVVDALDPYTEEPLKPTIGSESLKGFIVTRK